MVCGGNSQVGAGGVVYGGSGFWYERTVKKKRMGKMKMDVVEAEENRDSGEVLMERRQRVVPTIFLVEFWVMSMVIDEDGGT